MVKNADGTFQKLGSVAANMVGTVSQLRKDLKASALPAKVREKPFVILRETLKEIEPADEKKLTVSEVYTSDCVLLKWHEEQGIRSFFFLFNKSAGNFLENAFCFPFCKKTHTQYTVFSLVETDRVNHSSLESLKFGEGL